MRNKKNNSTNKTATKAASTQTTTAASTQTTTKTVAQLIAENDAKVKSLSAQIQALDSKKAEAREIFIHLDYSQYKELWNRKNERSFPSPFVELIKKHDKLSGQKLIDAIIADGHAMLANDEKKELKDELRKLNNTNKTLKAVS